MDWLEQNIDAYRIIADLLVQLRLIISSELKEEFGSDWATEGLPSNIYEGLIRTKEDESAVDWYEDEYQELFNYTSFSELHEILLAHEGLFPCLTAFLPTPSLLSARFMELEVVRRKLGRMRPIGEVELNFLMKFHLHFRKAVDKRQHVLAENEEETLKSGKDVLSSDSGGPELVVERPEEERVDIQGESEDPESTDKRPNDTPRESDGPRPPQRMASKGHSPSTKSNHEPVDMESEAVVTKDKPPIQVPKKNLSVLLEKELTPGILRELFLEVTRLAENLWSSDVPESPVVWNAIRISSWYEKNFVALGLKPLSDFYDLMDRVHERLESGLARHELKALLQEARFSETLLNLRDMFQKSGLHGPGTS